MCVLEIEKFQAVVRIGLIRKRSLDAILVPLPAFNWMRFSLDIP